MTTDFGLTDQCAGVMKGAVFCVFPGATIIDITHDIKPQDILGASLMLETVPEYFPPGTVHLAVVDPGVGGTRKGIIARNDRGDFFVGPDNGIFTMPLGRTGFSEGWVISEEFGKNEGVSATFHGRDIFSPIAGLLASGKPPESLGSRTKELVRLNLPENSRNRDRIKIPIIWRDHFGNLITILKREELKAYEKEAGMREKRLVFELGGKRLDRISRCYEDVEHGEMLLLVGSTGRMEVSVRDGDASVVTGLGAGDYIHAVFKKGAGKYR